MGQRFKERNLRQQQWYGRGLTKGDECGEVSFCDGNGAEGVVLTSNRNDNELAFVAISPDGNSPPFSFQFRAMEICFGTQPIMTWRPKLSLESSLNHHVNCNFTFCHASGTGRREAMGQDV